MAFVLEVMHLSIASGEIKPVSYSTSAKTTFAPVNAIVVLVGSAVSAVLITSSSLVTPIKFRAMCKAAVPELRVKQ